MLEIGVAARPKQGATISGDRYVICNGGPSALIAVIDGLGGGAAAATAAERAAGAIETHREHPLDRIMTAAHHACIGTRGAVIGLLRIDLESQDAAYVGVGNIGAYVVSHEPARPISRNGIVGYRLPHLREQRSAWRPGDTFILYSDGISQRLTAEPGWSARDPQAIADEILACFGKHNDDATVVVIRPTSS
jgi:phosphoserine phosphatase RsbX